MTHVTMSCRDGRTRLWWVLLLLATLLRINAGAQTFEDIIRRVQLAPLGEREARVDTFLATVAGVPLVEHDTLVTFLWRGSAVGVSIAGDHNRWSATAGPMTRLSSTDLWYRREIFPSDARVDYKIVLDGKTWILDPRNANTMTGGFGPNSELRLPGYRSPSEVLYNPRVPHGRLSDTTIFSQALGNRRKIQVYVPPGYAKAKEHYPLIVVHDGLEYVSLAHMDIILDNLIASKRVVPVVAVFVPPVDRTAEYSGAEMDHFASFIVSELLPFLQKQYRISPRASDHATLGTSNGGNIALWLGLMHPEVFGYVAAQSSNVIDSISRSFQNGPMRNLRLYLDLGTYDLPMLIPLVRNLRTILETGGYPLLYREVHEGHSWGSWRGHLRDILEFFFPGRAGKK